MKKAILTLLLIFSAALTMQAQTVEELRTSAEKLKSIYSEPAALAQYLKILDTAPNDYDALWNASFLLSKIGNRIADEEQKSKYFNKAKDLAEKAIKANSQDAEGYFVMSVALGRIALIAGARDRVAASKSIKEYAQLALKYNGQHAGAWDVLGRWNFKVANLSFAERAAADMLFGGAPKGATDENAVKCYRTAIQIEPEYILYYHDLGEVLLSMEAWGECKKILNQGLALKSVTPDDDGHKTKMREMLAKCK